MKNMQNLIFRSTLKSRIWITQFIEKWERYILHILHILRIDDLPEKCILSDKKENLVLPFSHFEYLFLSTLKNHWFDNYLFSFTKQNLQFQQLEVERSVALWFSLIYVPVVYLLYKSTFLVWLSLNQKFFVNHESEHF